jgi:hypothetical protein
MRAIDPNAIYTADQVRDGRARGGGGVNPVSESAVKVLATMYEARSAMRRLYGARYDEVVGQKIKEIREFVSKNNVSELEAVKQIVTVLQRENVGSGVTQALFFAALVEMDEGK